MAAAAQTTGNTGDPVLRALGLGKTYTRNGADSLELFRDLSLVVAPGEMVAIVGESGAGKSSLLHILAAMDTATAGQVWCGATEVTRLSGRQAADFRNRDVGYVWQFHYLLPEFTAAENVAMPLLARGVSQREALRESEAWLAKVGLATRGEHRAGELSGGEQQRVSIARALVTRPKLLLADEPTGDLDNTTAENVFLLLQGLQREHALAAVLVTHNLEFAARCDRVLRLRGGALTTA
ncbi:MAG TPA: ABC transporter ATP-binding protein [Acidobacteriaceae bacterium]|jgi:lipoprotein-releasing system ATP-binding protein